MILPVLAYQPMILAIQVTIQSGGEEPYRLFSFMLNGVYLSVSTVLLCVRYYRSEKRVFSLLKTLPVFLIFFILFVLVMSQAADRDEFQEFLVPYYILIASFIISIIGGGLFLRIRRQKGFFILGFIVSSIIIAAVAGAVIVTLTARGTISPIQAALVILSFIFVMGIYIITLLPFVFMGLYNSYYFSELRKIFDLPDRKTKPFTGESVYINGKSYPVRDEPANKNITDYSETEGR